MGRHLEADWTNAVKGGDRAQGQGVVHAAAQGGDGAGDGPDMADVMRLLQKKPTL
jgi:hypothetical protein